MKKLLVLIPLVILYLQSISQIKGTFKAVRTDRYDYINKEWKHVNTSENTNIPIVMLAGFIHIKADSDGYISYDQKTMKTVEDQSFRGVQYIGYDYTIEQPMIVSMVVFKKGGSAISIVFSELGVNIIYILEDK